NHLSGPRRTRRHRQLEAEIANDGRDDVAAPAVRRLVRVAAPQADPRRVDRFLPERAETLALERGVLVADLAAGEERLQPVVSRAGEDHPAQNLEAFLRRQRRP